MNPAVIQPVGIVECAYRDFKTPLDYSAESVVALRPDLEPALAGIDYYSHLHVLYHQHRRDEWMGAIGLDDQHPPLATRLPGEPYLRGMYAARSPGRPSGLGWCVVELLRREGTRLFVRGLDALDGTPVLDIKVYVPEFDSFPGAVAPLGWCCRENLRRASQLLRWSSMSVSLTLGLRAGQLALRELGIAPGRLRAMVSGSTFFAQGVEGVTGCSELSETLTWDGQPESVGDWSLRLASDTASVLLRLRDQHHPGAAAVLDAPDTKLFESPLVERVRQTGAPSRTGA